MMNTHTDTPAKTAASAGEGLAKDLSQKAAGFVDQALQVAAETAARIRRAYEHNPARTLTIGALSLAGAMAVLTTLSRR